MANNQNVNKVVFGAVTIIDISPTTAIESDVANGKVFFKADGSQATGTASGGGGGSSITVGFETGDGAEHIHYIDANGTFHTVSPDILDPNQGIIGWIDTVLEGTMIAVSSTMTGMLSNLTNMTLVGTITVGGTRPNPRYIFFYYAHS